MTFGFRLGPQNQPHKGLRPESTHYGDPYMLKPPWGLPLVAVSVGSDWATATLKPPWGLALTLCEVGNGGRSLPWGVGAGCRFEVVGAYIHTSKEVCGRPTDAARRGVFFVIRLKKFFKKPFGMIQF